MKREMGGREREREREKKRETETEENQRKIEPDRIKVKESKTREDKWRPCIIIIERYEKGDRSQKT